jgi:hypothetical protein
VVKRKSRATGERKIDLQNNSNNQFKYLKQKFTCLQLGKKRPNIAFEKSKKSDLSLQNIFVIDAKLRWKEITKTQNE